MMDDILKMADELIGDDFEKTANYNKQAKLEKEAVLRWQKDRNQKDFAYLYKSMQPVINSQLTRYTAGSPVPRATFRGEVAKLFVKALETYDPTKGTKLSTHLTTTLSRLFRINLQYQNVGRISSESLVAKMTSFQNRKSFLEDKLGREPSSTELADDLGWSLNDVEKLVREDRKDAFIGSDHWVVDTSAADPRFKDKLNYLYQFEAKGKEKLVLEYTYGLGGKPEVKRNIDIARFAGITPNRVSQIKSKFAKKLRKI